MTKEAGRLWFDSEPMGISKKGIFILSLEMFHTRVYSLSGQKI
jgi:hypothetical protein